MSVEKEPGLITDLEQFYSALERFDVIREARRGRDWFKSPDHLSILTTDRADFHDEFHKRKHEAKRAVLGDINGLYSVALNLKEKLPLGSFGSVEWLVLREPKQEEIQEVWVNMEEKAAGIEHLEFHFQDLEYDISEVSRFFADKGFETEPRTHDMHEGISLIVDIFGHELRINSRSLQGILEEGVEKKKLTEVRLEQGL